MADDASKSELRTTWESAAPGWAKWEHVFATALSDATDMLLDRADIREGMRVLDLACGAGSQSLRAAERVGPSGRIVAADISGAMLAYVRENAARAGLHNVELVESAAEDLQEPEGSFDAAISRLGLMLFASPRGALQAVRRALRPGRRFSVLVFSTADRNPLMAQPMAILLRHAGKSPPAPGKPGLFALGSEGVLQRLMTESALEDARSEVVRAAITLPSASEALQLLQEAGGAYRAVVAGLNDVEKAKAWSEVYQCLRQFESDGGFTAELELLIGTGAKSG